MAQSVKTIEHEAHAPAIITPAEMVQQAIAKGSGVDVMERLLALQERHDAFQARKAFDNAMADLRNNLPKIIKSREVDFTSVKGRTHYKFEDLAEITEALSGPMSDVGLSFRWYTENVQGGVKVTCRITHRDGHFEETSLVGPLDASGNKNPIQAIGSAVSYLQRYTIKAAVGIAASHDDDAQSVSQRKEPQEGSQQQASVSKDEQARAIYTMHQRELRLSTTKDQLREAWKAACADKEFIPGDWQRELRTEMEARLAEIEAITSDDDFPGDLTDAKSHLDRIHEDTAA
jgi:hypothetical protein